MSDVISTLDALYYIMGGLLEEEIRELARFKKDDKKKDENEDEDEEFP
jgi:hypothetical protein